jgi:hypothetical protein
MTSDAGLSANTFVTRVIFLFTVALLTACGQSEIPVRQETLVETAVAPLVETEWHPTPRHAPGLQGSFAAPLNQNVAQAQPQPANQAYGQSHQWSGAPQQPVYAQPPPVIVFQGQEYVPAQSQQPWSYQQPVPGPTQPWYQQQQPYVQRPWGNTSSAEDQGQSNTSQQSWPQGNFYAPVRTPAADGYPAYNSEQYWTAPPANYYGNVW